MRLLILIIILGSYSFSFASEKSDNINLLMNLSDKYWIDMPYRNIICAQVEQESAWKTNAKLSTKRELGRGLAQITIAYTSDGKIRFNTFEDAKKQYKELRYWDYINNPYSPKHHQLILLIYHMMQRLYQTNQIR